MQFQFAFRHMETSPSLQEYTESKIRSQIERFVSKAIEAHVIFSVDKHQHHVHCSLVGGDGFTIQVDQYSEDMYAAVDKMSEKIEVQLRRKKERLKDHKGLQRADRNLTLNGYQAYEPSEVDAEDIIKYEQSRKRASGR